ncbi:MAG: apolipoprotein N-acyltransferase [Candidatus Sumerlaeia bacterium]
MRLPYPKFNWWWVAWFGLVPLVFELRWRRPLRVVFFMGWAFGFTFYYSNVSWLNVLIYYNRLVPVGIVLLGLAMGFVTGVWALGAELLARHVPRLAWLLAPALWVALEWWRAVGQLAFPWTYLATSQYWWTPIIQMADVTGVWGLSFLIVLVNWALAHVLPPYYDMNRLSFVRRFLPLGVAAVLVASAFGYGMWALGRAEGDGRTLRVAVIQPNVPQKKKFASYSHPDPNEQRRLQTQINMEAVEMIEAVARRGVALIVLPESAFPSPLFNLQKTLVHQLQRLSREAGAPLLFGANEMKITSRFGVPLERWEEGASYQVFNCAWLLTGGDSGDEAHGGLQLYRKMLLVPFGETVPYLSAIPGFAEHIVGIGSFTPGTRPTVFRIKGVAFSAVICFESAFPQLLAEMNRRGAQLNFVLTNDGWYETSAGPYQHLVLSGFRAVEGRRAVVRAANNGVSAIFDPWGRLVREIPLNVKDTMIADVPLNSRITFYQRWGEWFAYVCLLGSGAGLFAAGLSSRGRGAIGRRARPPDAGGSNY